MGEDTQGGRTTFLKHLQPGSIIDVKFRIERSLGAGGMGEVFLVRDIVLACNRAMKVLLPNLQEL